MIPKRMDVIISPIAVLMEGGVRTLVILLLLAAAVTAVVLLLRRFRRK